MADIRRLPGPNDQVWEWQYAGSCRDQDANLFFHPEGERGPARDAREEAANAVCARCPVITQCLEQALAVQEPYGVWGGTTESERADLLARRGGLAPAV